MKSRKKKLPKVYKVFGEKIRQCRQMELMTQSDVAAKVGLSREAIVAIEGGTYGNINLDQFIKFANAVDTSAVILASVIFKEV